jgi:hypothetical protein
MVFQWVFKKYGDTWIIQVYSKKAFSAHSAQDPSSGDPVIVDKDDKYTWSLNKVDQDEY